MSIDSWPTELQNQLDKLKTHYNGKKVVVTGGGSFIGSHLVDALLDLGSHVVVVDDFSSGSRNNMQQNDRLRIVSSDLYDTSIDLELDGVEILFHLAAIHGGRGFIEKNSTLLLKNLTLDYNTFSQAKISKVGTVVFASSACAYSTESQSSSRDRKYLEESIPGSMDENPSPDGMYGWTKLIGEYQLRRFFEGSSTVSRAARIFTAYGDRENESHAAIALIAKSLLKMDPFPVWGDGEQTRNFTYVSDTVTGLLLLGTDKVPGFEICNVGTSRHITVNEFINEVFLQLDWKPNKVHHELDKPAGVASRSSNNSKILEKFGWEPQLSLAEGIRRTIDWYKNYPDKPQTIRELEEKLMSR